MRNKRENGGGGVPLVWLSSFQASPTHLKFPSSQSLCAFFSPPPISMPKQKQKLRAPAEKRGFQNLTALKTLQFLPMGAEAPPDLPLASYNNYLYHSPVLLSVVFAVKAKLVVFHFSSTFMNAMERVTSVVNSVDAVFQESDTDDFLSPQFPLA